MDELLEEWYRSASSPSEGSAAAEAGGRATLSSLRSGQPDHSFLLESSNKASIFLEPGAVDSSGALRPGLDAKQAVRKVAHGIHMPEGSVRDFVHSPKVA